ncbi:DUF262 domain-containing protein [Marinicauda pacifica]|uniref:DUF262 domain-containing protein n=1 Tax=Marinicauda pacifica TaxID=1133559 RepID=UPI0035C814B4
MKTTATNWRIRKIVTDLQAGDIVPRPYFQRRLVWSLKDKYRFIETILKDFPFPEIYVADGAIDLGTAAGTYLVVDGQQRITTIFDYFSGELPGSDKYRIPPYSGLTDDQKKLFLSYDVAVRDLGDVAENELKETFQRINATNYALNDMEVNNALYEGEYKTFCENFALLDFFERHRFFRPMQLRRMGDVKYTASIVTTMLHGYYNRDDALGEYLDRYNEEFPFGEEMRSRIQQVIDFIENMSLDLKSRAWKQADFFTLFVELDRLLNQEDRPLAPRMAAETLERFYFEVDRNNEQEEVERDMDVERYARAVLQAANDRINRVRRGEVIRKLLVEDDES